MCEEGVGCLCVNSFASTYVCDWCPKSQLHDELWSEIQSIIEAYPQRVRICNNFWGVMDKNRNPKHNNACSQVHYRPRDLVAFTNPFCFKRFEDTSTSLQHLIPFSPKVFLLDPIGRVIKIRLLPEISSEKCKVKPQGWGIPKTRGLGQGPLRSLPILNSRHKIPLF